MNTYYVTEDSFPHLQRSSAIVQKVEVEVSPVENAIHSIVKKNKELLEIITKFERTTTATTAGSSANVNISPFTMILKGCIDAAVNGGVNMYKSAFLGPEYLAAAVPGTADVTARKQQVARLQDALFQQLDILEKGTRDTHRAMFTC